MRESGIVVKYFRDRGFGWIQTPDNTTIFYHVSEVPGRKILTPGTAITYELAIDEKNRPRATKINIVETPVSASEVSC